MMSGHILHRDWSAEKFKIIFC